MATPSAQSTRTDPVRVDPKHYKVEVENDQVRVLRIKYGPHEKSVMHGHPSTVAVFLIECAYSAPSWCEAQPSSFSSS